MCAPWETMQPRLTFQAGKHFGFTLEINTLNRDKWGLELKARENLSHDFLFTTIIRKRPTKPQERLLKRSWCYSNPFLHWWHHAPTSLCHCSFNSQKWRDILTYKFLLDQVDLNTALNGMKDQGYKKGSHSKRPPNCTCYWPCSRWYYYHEKLWRWSFQTWPRSRYIWHLCLRSGDLL